MNKQQAIELILQALKVIVTLGADIDKITEDTVLMGKHEFILDSFGLATVVLEIEELISEKYDKTVSIMGSDVFSVDDSPFRTVGTLADYLIELMK